MARCWLNTTRGLSLSKAAASFSGGALQRAQGSVIVSETNAAPLRRNMDCRRPAGMLSFQALAWAGGTPAVHILAQAKTIAIDFCVLFRETAKDDTL